jgi:hypothetical protein
MPRWFQPLSSYAVSNYYMYAIPQKPLMSCVVLVITGTLMQTSRNLNPWLAMLTGIAAVVLLFAADFTCTWMLWFLGRRLRNRHVLLALIYNGWTRLRSTFQGTHLGAAQIAGRNLMLVRVLNAAGLVPVAFTTYQFSERWLAWGLALMGACLLVDAALIAKRLRRGVYGYNALEFAEIAAHVIRSGGEGPTGGARFFGEEVEEANSERSGIAVGAGA